MEKKEEYTKETYAAIENFKAWKGTPDTVFAGTKSAQGWKSGKMVSEKEYDAAVAEFVAAPMDGRM